MIRRVDPTERHLFQEAFDWSQEFPRWYRSFEDITFEEFLSNAEKENQVDVGVFGPGLVAVITLKQIGHRTHEVHLLAKRGIDKKLLATACQSIRRQTAPLVDRFVIRIFAKNHGLLKLAREIGFEVINKDNGYTTLELRNGNEAENYNDGDDERDADGYAVGLHNQHLRLAEHA